MDRSQIIPLFRRVLNPTSAHDFYSISPGSNFWQWFWLKYSHLLSKIRSCIFLKILTFSAAGSSVDINLFTTKKPDLNILAKVSPDSRGVVRGRRLTVDARPITRAGTTWRF